VRAAARRPILFPTTLSRLPSSVVICNNVITRPSAVISASPSSDAPSRDRLPPLSPCYTKCQLLLLLLLLLLLCCAAASDR
jgi:hypothetical protein